MRPPAAPDGDGLHRISHAGERWGSERSSSAGRRSGVPGFRPVTSLNQERGQGGRKPESGGESLHLCWIGLGHHRPPEHWGGKDAHHDSVPQW